jgi:hypothetical protein
MNKWSVLICLVIVTGCGRESAGYFDYNEPATEVAYDAVTETSEYHLQMPVNQQPPPPEETANDVLDQSVQHIIKTVSLSLEVAQLDSIEQKVQVLTPKYKGYVARSSRYNYTGGSEITMTIRVPVQSLDALVLDLEKIALQVTSKEADTKDVGEEFVDLQTRLENKRAAEKRYREILRQANTIEDILKVEDRLRRIREEIEAKEGRLKYLKDQVAYSTINLRCNQPNYIPAQGGPSYSTRVKKALSGGWDFMETASIALVLLWPLWILAASLWLLFRYRSKLRQKSI